MTKNVLSDLNVAFVGAGAMASAMIGGLLARHDVNAEGIIASDRHQERLDAVGGQFGVRTTRDNREAARNAQVVVLSVKPQVLPGVLTELRGAGAIESGALVVSIVAGATIASISTGLGHRAIVRTMPNTPAQVGEGMTVWTATPEVSSSSASRRAPSSPRWAGSSSSRRRSSSTWPPPSAGPGRPTCS